MRRDAADQGGRGGAALDLLGLAGPGGARADPSAGISPDLPAIGPAVDRFAARLEALAARGWMCGAGLRGEPRAHHAGILRRLRLQLLRAAARPAAGGDAAGAMMR